MEASRPLRPLTSQEDPLFPGLHVMYAYMGLHCHVIVKRLHRASDAAEVYNSLMCAGRQAQTPCHASAPWSPVCLQPARTQTRPCMAITPRRKDNYASHTGCI